MLELREPHPDTVSPRGCITLIGMAASGKTTIGRELAALTGWAHLDTDHVIEALYGVKLQSLTDTFGKEGFLDIECRVVQGINVQRTILSTGGSVVYRQPAMDSLSALGPVIHIDVPLTIILARIARKPDRGLAIAPGQTIEDLYHERRALYEKAATVTFTGSEEPAPLLAKRIADWLCSPH